MPNIGNKDIDGVIEINDASNVVQERLQANGLNYSKGLSFQITSETVADDAYIDVTDATSGMGFVQAGDGEEYAIISFTNAGAVTLVANSANAVNTDTDTKLCIFDNGTSVRIRNRLGAPKTIRAWLLHSA